MSEVANLIARLEAATEGSAALDRGIHYALWRAAYKASEPRDHHLAAKALEFPQDHYTRSLDAALTLVDGEGFWRLGHDGAGPNPGDFLAEIWPARGATQRARHPSAVIALCIAALKARLP